jgi:phenylalanyl-tRNA synthetase beta chain
MKISLNWLRDYVDADRSAEQVVELLSDVGFPCEGIEYLGEDAVIDVEVTSNRGDCLGYIGVARELAAATGRTVKTPSISLNESDKDVTAFARVEIHEPDLCGRYTARIIEDVKVAPSPEWLRKRLEAIGLRSVNNVVDATNYAMMETGQPPHAFDYAKIAQGKIVVRRAVAGERLVSIDGTECELHPDMLIIADPEGPVAIAGVMGGLETEVSQTTTTILLEDASFNPLSVRTTSRRLALPSEASYRFERIVDIEKVDWASQRTAQLIVQVAGGRIAKGVVDIYPKKPDKKEVTLRLSRLTKLLGIDISLDRAVRILTALCFEPTVAKGIITCTVPSWRSDVYREVDLIEEVARVHGYRAVPTERKIKIEVVPVDTRHQLAQTIGTFLNGCGFYETINVSFVERSTAGLFNEADADRDLAVKDESRKSANLLRRTLIASLLGVLKTNLNAKNVPCRIFELADVFTPTQKGALPVEKAKLALVCDGEFRDLRGVIEALIRRLDQEADIVFRPADLVWADAGATVLVNGDVLGEAGIVSKAVRGKFDFKEVSPCAAEIDFERLMRISTGVTQIKPIPRFPSIQRDLSLIVDEDIRWADIVRVVKSNASSELEHIQFVDIYRGKGVASGKKSVTVSLRFRDNDGTLTHENVDRLEADIVGRLSDSIAAALRTA